MSRASRSYRRNRWRAYQGISGDCTTIACYAVSVPQGKCYVDRMPAEVFFLRFDHIFEMFLTRRLDFTIVRLFALHMSFVINREEISQIAVADPYYIHEFFLSLSDYELKTAREYIENFMLMNKDKEMVLVPYHPM